MGDIELQIFSDRLKELRAELKLTQAQFVEGLGITSAALSAYEKNSKNPSISVAKRIAEKYHISLDWLCGLSNKRNIEDRIETYGDIIRLLFKLEENIDINVSFELVKTALDPIFPSASISFGNFKIQEFIKDWEKMKDLHDKSIIDDDVYNLWMEKTLKEYDSFATIGDGWNKAPDT